MFEVIAIMTIVALVFVILILMMHISRLKMRLDMTRMKASDPSTECARATHPAEARSASDPSTECVTPDTCDCGHVFNIADIAGGRCTSCMTMICALPSTECVDGCYCDTCACKDVCTYKPKGMPLKVVQAEAIDL